jgi:hypothetical protein
MIDERHKTEELTGSAEGGTDMMPDNSNMKKETAGGKDKPSARKGKNEK